MTTYNPNVPYEHEPYILDAVMNMIHTDTGAHWIVEYEEETGAIFYEEGDKVLAATVDEYKSI